ncbi:hypothetical protein DPSP01_008011 [Paraphaeosphaeria sporulosa]|uniref:Uncharacterized protein n=1 Tax=Paraphaeosphaeria sporulosa TaxID=1460663 RepID=A0A177CFG1_9PLEO|nr:uncharacterized protein CC84DRAFT_1216910 [Paraphaeosphaeria sporulosa]OAG05579.1 hypothetical protein CC84DRAFT_1216910 [Paraphaeosphaeria sporulosa]
MPLFAPLTLYTAHILRLRNLIHRCIKALNRARPAFLALLTSCPADPSPAQLHPFLNYVEIRFAIGLNIREYWAWRAVLAVVRRWGDTAWWVAGLLWAAVGCWVLGRGV